MIAWRLSTATYREKRMCTSACNVLYYRSAWINEQDFMIQFLVFNKHFSTPQLNTYRSAISSGFGVIYTDLLPVGLYCIILVLFLYTATHPTIMTRIFRFFYSSTRIENLPLVRYQVVQERRVRTQSLVTRENQI